MPADHHIVGDLHQVVDLGALADHGVAQAPAVDRGAGANLDVVLNDNAADLRHLDVALGARHVAEAVLADVATRMNDDAIADRRVRDGAVGANRTVAADAHLRSDHRAGGDHRAGANLGARPDHCAGVDRRTAVDLGRRMNLRACRDAVAVEQ